MIRPKHDKLMRALGMSAIPVALIIGFALGWLVFGKGTNNARGNSHDHAQPASAEVWTCSMHPQIRASEPGQCPICGMDLIPAATDESTSPDEPDRISLSENARIRSRIRTSPVRRVQAGGVQRRLLGRVDYDETRLRTITSWISGRIDRLRVRSTGQRVKSGQIIATLYSPEVFSAHQDLLVAKQQVARLQGASDIARAGAEATLDASRDRLRLLGVPAAELQSMEKASRPSEQVRIRSPFGGTIIERMATEGTYVKTGAGLYQIADLSRLWVQLDAYESDLPLLSTGQEVTLEVEGLPADQFDGRVTFVDPVLNQRTRTTRVRIEVKNPEGTLKPGMFAEAVVQATGAKASDIGRLLIPQTAPLFTGRRSIVYVEVPDTEDPTYEARVVRLGPKIGDSYPVIAGLREGERVVIHGAFTLDADLQIRGGLSMMSAPDDTEGGPYDQIVVIPSKHEPALATVIRHYLSLHEALASDSLADARTASQALKQATDGLQPGTAPEFRDAWMPIRRQLLEQVQHLEHAETLDDSRNVFRDVSQQIATILRVFGNPTNHTVRLAFCPMALAGEGAEWVQTASAIENPYFGSSMHSCGEVHEVVEHGTYLPLDSTDDKPARRAAPAGGHQH